MATETKTETKAMAKHPEFPVTHKAKREAEEQAKAEAEQKTRAQEDAEDAQALKDWDAAAAELSVHERDYLKEQSDKKVVTDARHKAGLKD